MINLDVADYCHDCPDFKPVTEKDIKQSTFYNFGIQDGVITQCYTLVQCKYRYRCDAIHKYMKGLEKDGN